MKELRASDPLKYSQKMLAEMFNIPRASVAYLAPLPLEVHQNKMQLNFERQMKEESKVKRISFHAVTRKAIRARIKETELLGGTIPT